MTQLSNIHIKPAKNGDNTAFVTLTDGAAYHLHSTYDPVAEAGDWLKQFELLPNTAYIVLGFGLGYHVRVLLDKLPDNSIIVVLEQDSTQCLAESLPRNFPGQYGWCSDVRIHSIAAPARHAANATVVLMNQHYLKRLTLCRHYPSMAMQPEFFREIEELFMESSREYFRVRDGNETGGIIDRIENIWRNLPYFYKSPGIAAFYNVFANRPAIIVSAGPSLNKNIHLLKELTGKALIIASGTAVGALHKHGITPHVMAALDPWPIMYTAVKDFLQPDMTLLASPSVRHDVVRCHPGPLLSYIPTNSADDFPAAVRRLLSPSAVIPANFSVATAAFNFAAFTGANPVICIGQDLAYTSESHHADGVQTVMQASPKENVTFVPGYYGGTVQTDLMFKDIIAYLTDIFKAFPERTFINATEGGAYIPGAAHISLQEAAGQHLTAEYDFAATVKKLATPTESANQTEIVALLAGISAAINDSRERNRECMSMVDQARDSIKDGGEALDRLNRDLKAYIDGIKELKAYPYCLYYIEPMIKMLAYEYQDDPSPARLFCAYQVILKNLEILFGELTPLVEAARRGIDGEQPEGERE
ncbi:motility associated factor glycosyltransferase family protein [Acetonema longum]|uniref:6-hydroxymethylpterin diphosphokinase MptE-like domain-containing protein n=1 Tax=Acetonema longum DSM 6540 TaxID=1009370 RepID=F7NNV0_9FIRM|nr:6-hydroxymethylpterin diphosphokinase MptE-like protein [Acetonema longum]EGO62284.1 hypothetical protein ALO_18957 [Acetonema longum DSM 6540]